MGLSRNTVAFACWGAALAWGFGCSTSSSNTGDGGAAADCGPHDVEHYDGTKCSAATVTAMCTRSLGYNSATLETVCAVSPDGTLYLVDVGGDTYLSGEGWTFGPRGLSSADGKGPYPLEADSLSSADEARCESAQAACSRQSLDAGSSSDADAS